MHTTPMFNMQIQLAIEGSLQDACDTNPTPVTPVHSDSNSSNICMHTFC